MTYFGENQKLAAGCSSVALTLQRLNIACEWKALQFGARTTGSYKSQKASVANANAVLQPGRRAA